MYTYYVQLDPIITNVSALFRFMLLLPIHNSSAFGYEETYCEKTFCVEVEG